MAKYNKGGASFNNQPPVSRVLSNREIRNPSFRDQRKYSDVLIGKQQLVSKADEGSKTIPICFTLNVSENRELTSMLGRAVIAENTGVINLDQTETKVSAISASVKSMYSLSTTKILLVFECKNDATNVVSLDSPLWNVFDNVRIWSEGEMFDDRIVWLECFGIHPKCWSKENVRAIGEK